ncbi:MAG: hypothetical protein AAF196_10725 [Planctomycetota bacterium]
MSDIRNTPIGLSTLLTLVLSGLACAQPPGTETPAPESPSTGAPAGEASTGESNQNPTPESRPEGQAPRAEPEQQDSEFQPAAEEFLARLLRGSWGSNEPFPIDSFAGSLRITPLGDAAAETGRVDADLKVLFRSPTRIRYSLEESGRRVERGIDENGPWERDDQGTIALDSRLELEQARDALYGHLRSARILCELLDPAVAFAQLQPTQAVAESRFKLGREGFDAVRLVGRINRWPLWQPVEGQPAEAPVEIELYAQPIAGQEDQTESRLRLRAVVVRPLVRAAGVGEEEVLIPGPTTETILLREPRPLTDGPQLPTEVYICQDKDADGPEPTAPQAKIKILDPSLGEELGEGRFRRPK